MVLYVGGDVSRNRIDWEAAWPDGVVFGRGQVRADRAGLAAFAAQLGCHADRVVLVIESMTGARYVHDTLERLGWEVQIADARRARERIVALAETRGCKTDRTDAAGLADLARRGLVPEIWLPDPATRGGRELARFRLHLVKLLLAHDARNLSHCHPLLLRRLDVSSLVSTNGKQRRVPLVGLSRTTAAQIDCPRIDRIG